MALNATPTAAEDATQLPEVQGKSGGEALNGEPKRGPAVRNRAGVVVLEGPTARVCERHRPSTPRCQRERDRPGAGAEPAVERGDNEEQASCTRPLTRWSLAVVPGFGWKKLSSRTCSDDTGAEQEESDSVRTAAESGAGRAADGWCAGAISMRRPLSCAAAARRPHGSMSQASGRDGGRGLDALSGAAVLEVRQPVEPARQVPVPLAEQLHRRGQQDGADDGRVDQDRRGQPNPICLKIMNESTPKTEKTQTITSAALSEAPRSS
jgi:hypothetical protein